MKEIGLIPSSTSKVECCCFSSDGKLLASGGRDKKVKYVNIKWLIKIVKFFTGQIFNFLDDLSSMLFY